MHTKDPEKTTRFSRLKKLLGNIFSERYLSLHAFLLPLFIGLAGYAVRGVEPFGQYTLCAIDGWGQYLPMLREAERHFFHGGAWSFSGGLGFNFYAQSAYYTNSLLWIPAYLVPGEITPLLIDLTVLLRFSLSGLAFFTLLKKKYRASAVFLPFSTAYAFSSCAMAFINQFMWGDTYVLLPLIILGLERLYRKKKPFLYLFTLTLCICSCFYTAWMVCLFVCLWLILLLISDRRLNRREKWLRTGLFSVCSLLSGILSLPVLIPLVRSISRTISSCAAFPETLKFYHSLKEMLVRLLPFQKPSLVYQAPNIYFGILTLVPLSFFASSRRIPLRRKLCFLCLVLFLFLSLNLNIADFIWHGFHFPSQLPGRESFLFIFTVLLAAAEGFSSRLRQQADRHPSQPKKKKAFCLIFSLLFFAEVTASAINGISWAPCTVQSHARAMDPVREEKEALYQPDFSSGEFYRAELITRRDNGGMLYNYPGITWYSSLMPEDAYLFFTRLGLPIYAKNVSTRYDDPADMPLLNDLFGVRYLIRDDWTAEENEDALPLGFQVSDRLLSMDASLSGTAFRNELFKQMACCSDVLAPDGSVIVSEYLPALQILHKDPFVIDHIKNGYFSLKIHGTISVTENHRLLLLTLPAKNTRIRIDGKAVETLAAAGFLACTELSPGEHEVEIILY